MRQSRGWRNGLSFLNFTNWGLALLLSIIVSLVATLTALTVSAATLSVREINITAKNQVEIQFDGVVTHHHLNLDFVRDNVQFSFLNSSIYPAKMMHSEDSAFNKIFAYQYSPNLVRVRFTVDGLADAYKDKIKWISKGKSIVISFPERISTRSEKTGITKKADLDEQKESTLLSRVLGKNTENKDEKTTPLKLGQKPVATIQLGGAKPPQSAGRAFLMMALVVGALGLVLFYVKKKKNNIQAKKVGDHWISNLLPASMRKQKSFIEVMGQHSLGPKQSIVVIKIRGQQFVLGVTQDNVQLITQIDADESEMDLLEDPVVSASIGKMFGSKPTIASVTRTSPSNFDSLVKSSTGAGAIVARNAYQQQSYTMSERELDVQIEAPAPSAPVLVRSSIRQQIKKHLAEGINNRGDV